MYGSRSYDERVDIWSFACIFGEMLNGAPLFPGANDFDQLSRIMGILGSPTEKNWSVN
jgi:serine/threonine protein kinase